MMRITSLPKGYVFVFGSNEAGIHGAGAAKDAEKYFGAKRGKGIGQVGRSYAIPTKDKTISRLPLVVIERYVKQFLWDTTMNPELTYVVTPIGCGLAGYEPKDIGPMFRGVGNNVLLPNEFLPYIVG